MRPKRASPPELTRPVGADRDNPINVEDMKGDEGEKAMEEVVPVARPPKAAAKQNIESRDTPKCTIAKQQPKLEATKGATTLPVAATHTGPGGAKAAESGQKQKSKSRCQTREFPHVPAPSRPHPH